MQLFTTKWNIIPHDTSQLDLYLFLVQGKHLHFLDKFEKSGLHAYCNTYFSEIVMYFSDPQIIPDKVQFMQPDDCQFDLFECEQNHITGQDFEDLLGRDLCKLISQFQVGVVRVLDVTTLSSKRSNRASFKVLLADGRIIKAVRFNSEKRARRVWTLSRFLDPRHFPTVIAARGSALITQWIQGNAIHNDLFDRNMVKEAASIQSGLHTTSLPHGLRNESKSTVVFWRKRLDQNIGYLVNNAILAHKEAKELSRIAKMEPFEPIDVGLCHSDFCSENLVLDTKGNLIVIDLDSIRVSALPYDLARTTYRWPMNADQRGLYLNYYHRHIAVDNFLESFSFWIILAITSSAVFRIRNEITTATLPMDALRRLLHTTSNDDMLKYYGYRE